MPLPFILGAGAAIAGAVGVKNGLQGAARMKEANDTMKSAESRHKSNIARFETQSNITNEEMDSLGKKELEILESFEKFSQIIEKIQNRPEFKKISSEGIEIPQYDAEELKDVSVGAGLLLGGIGGAAAGTAGGFAAAGATTSAVMALGTASTGTAIASLSGAAATNATLAALGGGALGSSAFAGGMALGSTILGAATLGVGLLVGGAIFNLTGSSLSDKADEAWAQMKEAEETINKICDYMDELKSTASLFKDALITVNKLYTKQVKKMIDLVESENKTDWVLFSEKERLVVQNTVLLVSLLYNMCKVKLVLQTDNENELNKVNTSEIQETLQNTQNVLEENDICIVCLV